MCKHCVVEPFPDRGTTCLETGAFLANLKGCFSCGRRDIPRQVKRPGVDNQDGISSRPEDEDVGSDDDDDDDDMNEEQQTIEFLHKCTNCDHVIAKHEYTFELVDDGAYQEYGMMCLLCGRASDTRSVLPQDPREEKFF